jgi:hypothetical protein
MSGFAAGEVVDDEHAGTSAAKRAAAARLAPKAKTDFMRGQYRWAEGVTSNPPL